MNRIFLGFIGLACAVAYAERFGALIVREMDTVERASTSHLFRGASFTLTLLLLLAFGLSYFSRREFRLAPVRV